MGQNYTSTLFWCDFLGWFLSLRWKKGAKMGQSCTFGFFRSFGWVV